MHGVEYMLDVMATPVQPKAQVESVEKMNVQLFPPTARARVVGLLRCDSVAHRAVGSVDAEAIAKVSLEIRKCNGMHMR